MTMKVRTGRGTATVSAAAGLPVVRGICWTVCTGLVVLVAVAVPLRFTQIRSLQGLPPGIDAVEVRSNLTASGLSAGFYAGYMVALEVLFTVVCVGLAVPLLWRRSAEPMALFVGVLFVMLGTGFWTTVGALAVYHPSWGVIGQLLGAAAKMSLLVFFYLFPDGRFVPGWTRYVTIALGVGVLAEAVLIDTGYAVSNWPPPLFLGFLATLLASGVYAQVHRYRRVSGPEQRLQTKWVVSGFAVAITVMLGVILVGEVLSSLVAPGTPGELVGVTMITAGLLLVPLSITLAVLRHRLFDIDLIINRTLVYASLTAGVVVIYSAVVGYVGSLFRTVSTLPISLVAAALVAMLFAPLHRLTQRGVNKLMYGERDDPYAVLSRLAQRLEATVLPHEVLPAAVGTVADALRLPYVAVEVDRDGTMETLAAAGEPVTDPVRLLLVHAGEPVGRLVLGPRGGEDGFALRERRLLDDVVRQIGVAVHTVGLAEQARGLAADLQRSRERLVTAREEERRRLRRDLHDGLGPQLAGLAMKAEAAQDLIGPAPEEARRMLFEVVRSAHGAVDDVRRVVDALRPPALDALGLVGALRSATDDLAAGGMRVEVRTPDRLPLLSAAVEVATYRIVLEAVSNAARHGRAGTCEVRVAAHPDALKVEVSDDGRGVEVVSRPRRTGVGLASMRERAEELGGTLDVTPAPGGGTKVAARLPLGGGT